jgi:hypothetical protein
MLFVASSLQPNRMKVFLNRACTLVLALTFSAACASAPRADGARME